MKRIKPHLKDIKMKLKCIRTCAICLTVLILTIGCSSSGDDDDSSSTGAWEGWSQVETSTSPTARYRHSMVHLDGKILLFGGDIGIPADDPEGNWVPTSDTWEFDVQSNSWSQISPSSHPSARLWHNMAATEDKIVLFGGWGEVYQPATNTWANHLSDTWEYDLTTQEWSQTISNYTSGPAIRSEPGMAYVGNGKVALFGGRGGYSINDTYFGSVYNDVWVYDTSTQTWTEITTSSTSVPEERFWSVVFYAGNDTLIVMGGVDSEETMLQDCWEFDLNTGDWTQSSLSGDIPDDVVGPIVQMSDTRYILVNGECGQAFNPTSKAFTDLGCSTDMESREFWYGEAVDIGNSQILLFGGRGGEYPDSVTTLNDTWIYTDSE